jgi:hypothetical protein
MRNGPGWSGAVGVQQPEIQAGPRCWANELAQSVSTTNAPAMSSRDLQAGWIRHPATSASDLGSTQVWRGRREPARNIVSDKKDVHVVPNKDGNWRVKSDGAKKSDSSHSTQGDAIDRAKEIAKGRGADVVIHRPDGRIRDKDSYGSDPNPPKDKKH